MVGLGGLEPPTSRLSGVRSNQLSYRPVCLSGIMIIAEFIVCFNKQILPLHTPALLCHPSLEGIY